MRRILIVEDERAVAHVLEDFLDSLGFATETVSDGQEAIERARRSQPDLIIMDLMMPRLTGGEAASMLKREPTTADIPILAISGVSGAQDFEDVLAVDGILPKPFDLEDLEARVQDLLPSKSDGVINPSYPGP